MNTRFLRLPIVALVFQLQACVSGQFSDLRPPPTLGDDVVDCEMKFSTSIPSLKQFPASIDMGELQGWVALAYELKGEGRASNIRVIDSEPDGHLVEGAERGLSKLSFPEGEKIDNCVSVFTVYRGPG